MSRFYKLFVLFIFTSSAFLATLVPPFQSPDEFEHITRAYLLGRGEIVLGAPPGQSSGGAIDSGLNRYMERFADIPFDAKRKLTPAEMEAAKQIRWMDQQEFRPALGMAYYFPAIYAVHATGLFIGKGLDLSVDASYRLTRIILLIATCLILYGAFRLYRPPVLVLGLLVIPMSLFQFSSASLDGIATAIAILVISVFMRISQDRSNSSAMLFPVLMIGWLLIASSRLQLFPMVLLAVMAAFYIGRPKYLWIVGAAATSILAWQIVVMKTIVDGRVKLGASSAEIVSFYLHNPMNLIEVFVATLTNAERMRGYFSSFFGLLGWLDTPFNGKEYVYLLAMIVFIFVISGQIKLAIHNKINTGVLIATAMGAITIVFFAMLVTWTPHPAQLVDGVQGRYFLIPAIILAYGLNGEIETFNGLKRLILIGSLVVLSLYSLLNTVPLLMERY
jgi:uncharacterized membrane protein